MLSWDYNGDQIQTNVITFGIGLILESIIIDGSWEIESMSYETEILNNFEDYVSPVTVDQTNNRITVGATIHFGK